MCVLHSWVELEELYCQRLSKGWADSELELHVLEVQVFTIRPEGASMTTRALSYTMPLLRPQGTHERHLATLEELQRGIEDREVRENQGAIIRRALFARPVRCHP